MANNQDKYQICKLLDNQIRVIGLPLDEFIPIAIVVVAAFILKIAVWGVILGAVLLIALRSAKKGQGTGWLFNKFFWYAPAVIFKTFLLKTPPSLMRHWLC